MVETLFTNGVIAVREKSLLGDRLLRFCEMRAEEVLRALRESGFGGGDEESEALCEAEERALDGFIREFAPSAREKFYLLAPRDFHNAKALVKAKKLGIGGENLLAPEGLVPVGELEAAIAEENYGALGKRLGEAVRSALEEETTGAQIGALFDKALYGALFERCGGNLLLKKFLIGKADRQNILTAMRSPSPEFAAEQYVGGGKLGAETLSRLFGADREKAAHALDRTPYESFYRLCLKAREGRVPLTEAEREFDSFEAEYFAKRRYELSGKEPFLYYVFRRRAEISNVRILLVCLNAGLKEQDIKKRLRAVV